MVSADEIESLRVAKREFEPSAVDIDEPEADADHDVERVAIAQDEAPAPRFRVTPRR